MGHQKRSPLPPPPPPRAGDRCEGKARYPNKGRGKAAAAKQGRLSSLRLFTYYCPQCRGYHLTGMPPQEYRARQRPPTGETTEPADGETTYTTGSPQGGEGNSREP